MRRWHSRLHSISVHAAVQSIYRGSGTGQRSGRGSFVDLQIGHRGRAQPVMVTRIALTGRLVRDDSDRVAIVKAFAAGWTDDRTFEVGMNVVERNGCARGLAHLERPLLGSIADFLDVADA